MQNEKCRMKNTEVVGQECRWRGVKSVNELQKLHGNAPVLRNRPATEGGECGARNEELFHESTLRTPAVVVSGERAASGDRSRSGNWQKIDRVIRARIKPNNGK